MTETPTDDVLGITLPNTMVEGFSEATRMEISLGVAAHNLGVAEARATELERLLKAADDRRVDDLQALREENARLEDQIRSLSEQLDRYQLGTAMASSAPGPVMGDATATQVIPPSLLENIEYLTEDDDAEDDAGPEIDRAEMTQAFKNNRQRRYAQDDEAEE